MQEAAGEAGRAVGIVVFVVEQVVEAGGVEFVKVEFVAPQRRAAYLPGFYSGRDLVVVDFFPGAPRCSNFFAHVEAALVDGEEQLLYRAAAA